MAHVSIISSQSGEQIFEGAPRYIGAYLKPGYLEFQAIGSPTAISWHVGDYVVYPRTGKTYRLYRTPQIAEQGDTRRYGAAFLYENVQFFDDSKRLELCPFTDLVPGDNTVHFSTQNIVSFFGKPLNVAERVQACLENQYGAGTWEVRIVTTTDPDLLELLDTEVEFSVSGASCQQALDKVYELWNGLGWIHTVENGVNVITIGASNVRTNANTTVPFAYDNGLVMVERSVANADEIGTRLFAYGSMTNMDATYYRGLDIKDAESVDIEHLMIPLANWGKTDGLPDARKAYIEDAAAIAKLGLIPRTAYFDGTGDLPDIHPTIERMTIGEVYDAGGAGYLPDLSKWSRSQRIDEVVSPIVNPDDHGTSAERGQKYTEDISSHLASLTDAFINNDTVSWTIFTASTIHAGRLTLNFGQEPQPITLATEWTPRLDLKLAVYSGGKRAEFPLTIRQASQTVWQIILPESVFVSGSSTGLVEVRIEGVITNTVPSQDIVGGTFSTDASTTVTGGVEYELSKTFTITIPQIGFDIEKYAALGNGKTISMKTGMCSGRDFEIKSAKYVSSTDSWLLTLYRSSDEDLGIMFPNADYQIAAGDQYVLLDIAMPDMYVTVASNRLLEAARKLLTDISSERPFYSPQIDAKAVYNESRVLLEGMWMDVAFDSSREYVLIDSITIDENGSNIPTYEVSLRERKGIEWTENVGKSSSSRSSVSVNGGDTEQTGGVRSVGMTVPTGLTVQGSPITGAGIFKVGLAEGYKIPLVSELANYFELAADPNLVQLRQAYSYLGPRKGLIFEANEEADANADFEKVALPGGGYALHSRLPFYSDSFISAGGISPGGGTSAGNATLVAQTYGGTLSATGIEGINFYSKERVDQLLLTAGTVQTVAGVAPTNGDIPVASLKSALGLGAAAAYGIGSVASGNTGLVTGGSVYSAINEAVSSVMKMQGTTTTPLSDGSTTNPVVIDGESYTAKKGDVVLYDGKEYLWAGSAWEQLGDEASWALKTTSISAGTGLEGGGTLASNRTISINPTYQTYISNGNTAYGWGDWRTRVGTLETNLTALTTRVTTLEGRTNWDTYFGVDENGDIYVKKNGTTVRNFYSWGAVSAGGLSSGGGASGIDLAAMWGSLTNSISDAYATTKIAAAHIPDMASTYGYLKSITSSMVTNALGYTPYYSGNFVAGTNYVTPQTTLAGYGITDALRIKRLDNQDVLLSNKVYSAGETDKGDFPAQTECPTPYGMYLSLQSRPSNNQGFQIYGDTTGGRNYGIYYRARFAGDDQTTYQSWRRVLDEANYTTWINTTHIAHGEAAYNALGNYVLKSGDIMSGTLFTSGSFVVDTHALDAVSPTSQHIVINGYNDSSSVGYCPGIGFHIPNVTYGTLKLGRDSVFAFYNSTLTNYFGVRASAFYKAGGTSSQFLKADGSVDSNTYLTTSAASSTYVSSVALNDDYLRVTKNGANTDLTIPYASRAGYVDGTNQGNWDANSPGNYQYLWYYGQGGGVSNFPANLVGTFGSIANFLSGGGSESLNAQLAWGVNHDSTNVSNGIAWRAKNNLGWDTTWHRLYDDNYHPTADKLSTPRLIWGQSFDGTQDVNGDITLVGATNVSYTTYITNTAGYGLLFRYSNGVNGPFLKQDGTVGVGTMNPYYTLDVNGSIGCTTLTASGQITSQITNGAAFRAIQNRAAAGLGGWAEDFAVWQKADASSTIFNIGAYGSDASVSYVYMGCGVDLSTTSYALRFYPTYLWYGGNFEATGTIHSSTGIYTEGYVTAGATSSSSDERLKSGIKDFGYSAEMLMALRPREWDWNEKSYMKGHAAGVVAQELQQVMPYAIVERQYLSVNYDMLHGLEIAGLQDHETRIRQLERENAELKRRLNMN